MASVNNTIKTVWLGVCLVSAVAAVASVMADTRSNVSHVQREVRCLDGQVSQHDDVLDAIKDTLGDLRTEQRVQGQYLKSFIEEYRRDRKETE
jgi:cell division protein FtsL